MLFDCCDVGFDDGLPLTSYGRARSLDANLRLCILVMFMRLMIVDMLMRVGDFVLRISIYFKTHLRL